MHWTFKLALIVDALAVVIALYFLVSDAARGSSSRNGPMTLVTFGMMAWIGLSYYLYSIGYTKFASAMAWLPAFPLLGYGLIILIMIIGKPDFK